jgi:hypothetical protein
MRRSGVGSGGGIGMNKHVDSRAPKVEPKSHARNPAHVAQWGALVGNHATHQGKSTNYRGEPDFTRKGYAPPIGPTDNVAACGVGGGRKVYGSGSQSTYGTPAAGNPPPNRQRDALENE